MTNTEIKDLAPKMPTEYLRNFFAEKDIPEKTFELEGPGGTNFIPNTVVVEHMTLIGEDEADKIAGVLRQIDFHNGDVNDFLGHIAQALVK